MIIGGLFIENISTLGQLTSYKEEEILEVGWIPLHERESFTISEERKRMVSLELQQQGTKGL